MKLKKRVLFICALGALPAFVGAEPAAAPMNTPAPTPAAPKYSTTDSTIGDLLDNPTTKSTNENIGMARGMTLKQVQQYAPDKISDERLAMVDADFAALPTGSTSTAAPAMSTK